VLDTVLLVLRRNLLCREVRDRGRAVRRYSNHSSLCAFANVLSAGFSGLLRVGLVAWDQRMFLRQQPLRTMPIWGGVRRFALISAFDVSRMVRSFADRCRRYDSVTRTIRLSGVINCSGLRIGTAVSGELLHRG
jgi:hypothetical protein